MVDRGIRLQEVGEHGTVVGLLEGTADRADDALGDSVLVGPQRAADGQHRLPGLHAGAIAQRRRGGHAGVDVEHRQVAIGRAARQRGAGLRARLEDDLVTRRVALDDVVVGQNVALGIDNDAGPGCLERIALVVDTAGLDRHHGRADALDHLHGAVTRIHRLARRLVRRHGRGRRRARRRLGHVNGLLHGCWRRGARHDTAGCAASQEAEQQHRAERPQPAATPGLWCNGRYAIYNHCTQHSLRAHDALLIISRSLSATGCLLNAHG